MDTIKIQIDTNAEAASKSFEDLSKSFNDTDKSSQDLRKQIRGLKDELYKLTPGTQEYGKVLQDLGGKMDQLQETSIQLRAATGGLDTVFQTTTNAVGSLAAGFTAASGVVALFGGESEDLQKTFVKLQAAMSIMNGLKGFAGFIKTTRTASISLKAYINQMNLTRAATISQTTATATLATAEGTAAVATTGLGAAFRSLTAAIAANPIGAILVALTTAATVISGFISRSREAEEQSRKFSDALREVDEHVKGVDEIIKDTNTEFDNHLNKLKSLGMSQESLNEKETEFYEKQKQVIENQKKEIANWINANKGVRGMEDALDDALTKYKNLDNELINVNKRLKDLKSTSTNFSSTFDAGLSEIDDKFKVAIAGGMATELDKIKVYKDEYVKAINELTATHKQGRSNVYNVQMDASEREALIQNYKLILGKLEVEEKTYYATRKKNANDALKEYKKGLDEIKTEWEDYVKNLKSESELLSDVTSPDVTMARNLQEMMLKLREFNNEIVKFHTEAREADNLETEQINELREAVKALSKQMREELGAIENLPDEIDNLGVEMYAASQNFVQSNNTLLGALKDGRITIKEYNDWLIKAMQEFNDKKAAILAEMPQVIEMALQDVPESDKERLRQFYTEFISFGGELLPPDEKEKIIKSVTSVFDESLDRIEQTIGNGKDAITRKFDDIFREWSEGGKSYFGKSPKYIFDNMKAEADEVYNLVHGQYEAAIAELELAMSVLEKGSEAWETYNARLQELRQADEEAQKAYNERTLAAQRQHKDSMLAMSQSFTDAIGGLAGAMGDYYAEQAEQAKETYGENSEEYKKYLKKEGQMKIAQVWTNFASGVMATWATSEAFGPIAGPILAAIQTAALLATAIASTQMISRQSKAASSGGGESSVANVAGMTDRVIYADAQNTDQTAQLNAEYNSGNQKVYVTATDISDKQNENRVAVSNNGF